LPTHDPKRIRKLLERRFAASKGSGTDDDWESGGGGGADGRSVGITGRQSRDYCRAGQLSQLCASGRRVCCLMLKTLQFKATSTQ